MTTSREIRLKSRPHGLPTPECFELASVELPNIQDGQVLVKNLWMSVDPYMRGRMDDVASYVPPFELGKPLEGGAIGQVVASKNPNFAEGDYVESMMGWRECFVYDSDANMRVAGSGGLQKRDPALVAPQAYLGVAGMPGMTAYTGLLLVARAKAGETVFVSGAAGAVGSLVCQIARIHGCTVIGSAGSDEKVDWLKQTAGVDAAFNYKTVSSVNDALADACPQGIDVYFENVGGEHLAAAIEHMNQSGRIALCGLISEYNAPTAADDHSLFMQVLTKSLRIQGFIVTDYWDHYPEFLEALSGWIRDGQVEWQETVVEGIEKAPDAFLGLFAGQNTGKMLVRLAHPQTPL